ncbi:fimbrial protein [Pantoea sp. LS15]|uniref:fimbrial protein n=1 Tax=Enterobacterales TaxID=91347 RepID=UPI000E0FF672|nr:MULTISPECIES: fimbrial protein [Enterobacterales]NJQ21814.1 fimbrial protein [Pantoea sp. LS15]NKF48410.1 fimbrial protein [Pantoea sp. LS15]RDK12968.1 pilus assembly protein [Enterobacter sp. 9-2]
MKLTRLACLLAALTGCASAATVVSVEGNLLPPACAVHNGGGGDIDVDFGDDININRLNGTNYRQVVGYGVTCGDDGQKWPLRLRFVGTGAVWDAQALLTSEKNLGIRMTLNGAPVNFGSYIPVTDSTNLPVLVAVPVANPADSPDEGVFTAAANLQAEYY